MSQPEAQVRRGADAVREVFLTPRVVDRRAFEEFSATLKGLIEQAEGRREELSSAARQAEGLREAAGSAARELRQSLEQTLRAAQSFDERLSAAEEVARRAEGLDDALERLRRSSEELIAGRLGELEARLDEALERARVRLDESDARRARAIGEVESLIEGRLREGEQRARTLQEAFERRLGELESARAEKFLRLIDAIETRMDEGQSRLVEFDAAIEERVGEAQHASRRMIEEIDQRVQALELRGQGVGERLTHVVMNLEQRLERATSEGERQSEALIARIDKQVARMEELGRMIEPTAKAAESAQKLLRTLRESAERVRLDPDVLAQAAQQAGRLEELVTYLGQAPSLIREMHAAVDAARQRILDAREAAGAADSAQRPRLRKGA